MQIQIVCVGKLKEKYWTGGVEEYAKRLGAYAKLDIRELPDEKTPDSMSPAEEDQVRAREGERILGALWDGAHVVALAIDGETWSSEQLAAHLDKQAVYGGGSVSFVIGGSLGLSPAVLKRASIFCSDDLYSVQRDETWRASGRGVCLLTRITATVRTPSGNIAAEPYTSSGTSYSRFAIIQVGENRFQVTRIVS
ncbi:23S rRNA (pseudouridine(1915)-N(3))-methyltransferase RlmH [Paenibacillus sp. FSL W8-1187]|uniref:23S rRNA (pseudouridine(1915)-N(3))-methyltransferase RlmH n=1 Tax=Paenibacillus sp. FSL W8-1187 TaxID=2975339 RepID=UPI0030D8B95D